MQEYVIKRLMLYKNEFDEYELEELKNNIKLCCKVYQIFMIDSLNSRYGNNVYKK